MDSSPISKKGGLSKKTNAIEQEASLEGTLNSDRLDWFGHRHRGGDRGSGLGIPNWLRTRFWLYLAARLGRDWLPHSQPRLCQIPGSTRTGGRTGQHHQGRADIDAH